MSQPETSHPLLSDITNLPEGGSLELYELPEKSLIMSLIQERREFSFKIIYDIETKQRRFFITAGEEESAGPYTFEKGILIFDAHTHPSRIKELEKVPGLPEDNIAIIREIDKLPNQIDIISSDKYNGTSIFQIWSEDGVTVYYPPRGSFKTAQDYEGAYAKALAAMYLTPFDIKDANSLRQMLQGIQDNIEEKKVLIKFFLWENLPEDFLDPKYLDGDYTIDFGRTIQIINGKAYYISSSGELIEQPDVYRFGLLGQKNVT